MLQVSTKLSEDVQQRRKSFAVAEDVSDDKKVVIQCLSYFTEPFEIPKSMSSFKVTFI